MPCPRRTRPCHSTLRHRCALSRLVLPLPCNPLPCNETLPNTVPLLRKALPYVSSPSHCETRQRLASPRRYCGQLCFTLTGPGVSWTNQAMPPRNVAGAGVSLHCPCLAALNSTLHLLRYANLGPALTVRCVTFPLPRTAFDAWPSLCVTSLCPHRALPCPVEHCLC